MKAREGIISLNNNIFLVNGGLTVGKYMFLMNK